MKAISLRRRLIVISSLVLYLAVLAAWFQHADLSGVLMPQAVAQSEAATDSGANPRADYWRAVRRGHAGYTAVPGQEANILMQSQSQNWRQLRQSFMLPAGLWAMGIILALVVIYFLARGRIRIEGKTGKLVQRFTVFERLVHWFVVVVFALLGITGLILAYGRYFLMPLVGAEGFATVAAASIEVHNLFGPLFILATLMLLVVYLKDNWFGRGDWTWYRKGGGFFGGHASSGRFNAGEKLWFWMSIVLGLALCVTGLILVMPIFGQTRAVMEWSHLIHAGSALIFLSVLIGHIYVATIGVEGAFQGMGSGYVDTGWARQHHDWWYEEVADTAADAERIHAETGTGDSSAAAPAGSR